MSVVEWPVAELRFMRSELRLIFGRRRNWAGLAVLAAVPIVIAVTVRITEPAPGSGPEFLSAIVDNGYFVPLTALALSLPLFLPLAVAAISGDSVAGEANVGTLRYLLTVPVHRGRLLLVKYAAIAVFALAAVGLVAAVGLLVGLALFGGGPVTLLSGSQVGFGEGLLRLLAICGYLAAALSALGAIGLFVSTLTEQPIGAAITVLAVTMSSFILDSIEQLGWLHPYLPTHWWLAFGDLLRDPVYTEAIGQGLLSAGVYIAIFWAAAWARFAGRDVTS
jgi:ABC-2 type transport system permease protein